MYKSRYFSQTLSNDGGGNKYNSLFAHFAVKIISQKYSHFKAPFHFEKQIYRVATSIARDKNQHLFWKQKKEFDICFCADESFTHICQKKLGHRLAWFVTSPNSANERKTWLKHQRKKQLQLVTIWNFTTPDTIKRPCICETYFIKRAHAYFVRRGSISAQLVSNLIRWGFKQTY